MQAVLCPAGRHLMEMRYEPDEALIAWLINGGGIIALLASLVLECRKDWFIAS